MSTKTQAAYTPGPWRANLTPYYTGIYATEKVISVTEDKDQPLLICRFNFGSLNTKVQKEFQANAYLVAAAPELFQSLRSLRNDIYGWLDLHTPLIRQTLGNTNTQVMIDKIASADAALRKAEGKF